MRVSSLKSSARNCQLLPGSHSKRYSRVNTSISCTVVYSIQHLSFVETPDNSIVFLVQSLKINRFVDFRVNTFRLILKASVTKPVSGNHCKVSTWKFDGISCLDSCADFADSKRDFFTASRTAGAFAQSLWDALIFMIQFNRRGWKYSDIVGNIRTNLRTKFVRIFPTPVLW